MRTTEQRIVAFVLLLISGSMFAAGPAKGPRLSADGVEFPPVENAAAPFKANLPLILDRLGLAPEEVSGRVFSLEKSKDLAARRVKKLPDAPWFTFGVFGADLVALDLTEGRVTRIELIYNAAQDDRNQREMAEMAKVAADKSVAGGVATFTLRTKSPRIMVYASPDRIVYEVHPADYYFLTHQVKPDVAEGIKAGKPVRGMTLREAVLALGKPSGVEHAAGHESRYTWKQYGYAKGRATVTTLQDSYRAMQESILNGPDKVLVREVTATFKDGVLTESTDDHFHD